MIETSVLLTVYNRDTEVLLATLRGLWRAATNSKQDHASEVEVIVADDGSDKVPVDLIKAYGEPRFGKFVWHKISPYEAYRIGADVADPVEKGHNGPSRAFNEALALASGERVVAMSSDVIATPHAWRNMLRHDPTYGPWSPRVWDLDGVPFREYCGPSRIFPMPWFLVAQRDLFLSVGGWDETYLNGLSYDDNDIAGRLVAKAGWFCMDYEATVFHQSHEMLPYRLDIPGVKAALDRNRDWTLQKFGGIPFDGAHAAFDVLRKPVPSGEIAFQVLMDKDKMAQAMALTRGMLAGSTAA